VGRLWHGIGQLQEPSGVAVDASGVVYVADKWNNRIETFSTDGDYLGQWGYKGTANGQLYDPRGVSVSADGNVYVADTDNSRVQIFTSSGAYVGQWGILGTGNGQFNHPASIATGANGSVYVADTANNRIQLFGTRATRVKPTSWGQLKSRYAPKPGPTSQTTTGR
jgi:DNA-binding beta-propeller fold protein YncE